MQAVAQFADPGSIPVTITLTAPLKDFEALRDGLLQSSIPHYQVSTLIGQIIDASGKLRGRVQGEKPNDG